MASGEERDRCGVVFFWRRGQGDRKRSEKNMGKKRMRKKFLQQKCIFRFFSLEKKTNFMQLLFMTKKREKGTAFLKGLP